MADVTIRERAEEGAVRDFLDREWAKIDAESWTGRDVALTAERDGEIVGAAIGKCTAGVAHLGELMVAEGERDHGIGAQLLAAFERWAAAQGAHLCTLNTAQERPALRFYLRHGWRVAWVVERYYQERTFVWLVKEPGAERA